MQLHHGEGGKILRTGSAPVCCIYAHKNNNIIFCRGVSMVEIQLLRLAANDRGKGIVGDSQACLLVSHAALLMLPRLKRSG